MTPVEAKTGYKNKLISNYLKIRPLLLRIIEIDIFFHNNIDR